MPELIDERKVFSLLEVSTSIKRVLEQRYTSAFWVKAEMNKLNLYPQSGHCYPELVEKQEGKVVAELKANLWQEDYARINIQFLNTVREPLKDGIKVLMLAKICFDPKFGLSLKILDIDPNYTLGDLEKEKRETIEKLRHEGVYGSNKKLQLSLLPQRIAVISDETSKGYADFRAVIDNNPWRYKLFYMLFPSLLQGEKSVAAIIRQLRNIKTVRNHFDAVAIIRGGGGDVGLSSFNSYELCREIASFPIPVLTGIGHSTNETVSELVAHSNQITPTKLAEYILQQFHNYAMPVQRAQEKIVEQAKRIMREANKDLSTHRRILVQQANNLIKSSKGDLSVKQQQLRAETQRTIATGQQSLNVNMQLMKRDVLAQLRAFTRHLDQRAEVLATTSRRFVTHMKTRISDAERNVTNMSPEQVLKRGYSITLSAGKAVRNSAEISIGDTIETVLYKGSITSTIKAKNDE